MCSSLIRINFKMHAFEKAKLFDAANELSHELEIVVQKLVSSGFCNGAKMIKTLTDFETSLQSSHTPENVWLMMKDLENADMRKCKECEMKIGELQDQLNDLQMDVKELRAQRASS